MLKGQGTLAVIKNEFMKDEILKHTMSHRENIFERLRNPEVAKAYLEAAFESFEDDNDIEALLSVVQDVAEQCRQLETIKKRI